MSIAAALSAGHSHHLTITADTRGDLDMASINENEAKEMVSTFAVPGSGVPNYKGSREVAETALAFVKRFA